MREKGIQAVRKMLVKKMEELRVDLNSKNKIANNAERKLADPFDLAALETSRYVEIVYSERESALLADIRETIRRIDSGLYGICDSCGRAIRKERLLIEPTSRLCLQCQFRKERTAKAKNRHWPLKGASNDNMG